ncbi:hypothetical protein ABEB36_009618 [Hypothenemus hampei]|uniref:Uncharacterized protein n=1 Tax=Hypothenemus hampei TaxID=57062 RepID=A0ABD1EGW3_HYPHA
MVFTTEQVAFILMAHFRSGTRNPDGTWSYSLESCVDQFIKAFPNEIVDYEVFGNHKRRIVSRFENKNCICREKSSGRPTVLQQPVLEDIQARMRASPQNSIRKLAAQTGLSFFQLPQGFSQKPPHACIQSFRSSRITSRRF